MAGRRRRVIISDSDDDDDNDMNVQTDSEGEIPCPKRKKTANNNLRRGVRQRQRTRRLGIRESTTNHDDFFENMTYQQETPVLFDRNINIGADYDREAIDIDNDDNDDGQATIDTNNDHNTSAPVFLSDVHNILVALTNTVQSLEKNIDVKLSVMQKQITRLEVKIGFRRDSCSSTGSSEDVPDADYVSELDALLLPCTDIESLNEIEESLHNEAYETRLVRYTECSISNFNCIFFKTNLCFYS